MDSIRHLTEGEFPEKLDHLDGVPLSDGARQRLEWFVFAAEKNASVEEIADHFGIAPTTFRRWLKRFDPSKPSSLEEQSRRPKNLRTSDIEQRVVDLIEQYRRAYPTMGPRTLRKKLEKEHNITLSTSTIWRVIDRNRLFFADTMSHRAKRDESRKQKEDKNTNPNAGLGHIAATIVLAISLWSGLFGMSTVDAAESTSFTLSTDFPEYGAHDLGTSTSFQLQGGVTWKQQPAVSTNFKIVFAPGQAVSSSSAAAETAEAAEASVSAGGTRDATRERRIAEAKGDEEKPVPPIGPEPIPVIPPEVQIPISEIAPETAAVIPVPAPWTVSIDASECADQWSQALRDRFERTIEPAPESMQQVLRPAAPISPSVSFIQRIAKPIAIVIVLGLLLTSIGLLFQFFIPLFSTCRKETEKEQTMRKKHVRHAGKCSICKSMRCHIQMLLWIIFAILFFGFVSLWLAPEASAASTMANRHVYNGHLLDSSGNAIQTSHKLRFSYWTSADYVSTDITATGAINTGASTYGSWQETHTVTPDSSGYFSVELGTGTTLPSLSSLGATFYLQTEVRIATAADTAYELLDTDTTNTTVDRSTVLPVPFALNANTIDNRDTGTASGSVAILQSGAVFDMAHIPGGTQSGTFVIDSDNSVTGDVTLQFGGTLAKTLIFSQSSSWFEFNDDVRIQGNLTVTGLVNGIDIDTLQSGTGSLKTASGGALKATVNEGSYRISGTITNFAGSGNVNLSANTTNYLFFTSTGLLINTTGFPNNVSYIPLAEVVTSAGSVTGVTDRRVLVSDDREQTIEKIYNAQFEHVAYQGDATSNVGQLYVDFDNTNDRNFYRWTSSLSSIQDYDVFLRGTLPPDFMHWNTGSGNSIRLTYRSTSGDSANNQIDVSIFDTNGSPVTLSGSTTDLASTSWATTQIEFTGSPTWTAGGDFIIQFKMHSKSDNQMHLGDVKLRYITLPANRTLP